MYVPRQVTKSKTAAARRTESAVAAAEAKAARKQSADALLDLDAYISKRDFGGVLTLLRLQEQDAVGATLPSDAKEGAGSISAAQRTTWWLAYCHFQIGDYRAALAYFDQLLGSVFSPVLSGCFDVWRLSRACCLYYLCEFAEAEREAQLSTRLPLCNRLLYLVAHHRKNSHGGGGESVLLDRYKQLSAGSIEDQLALAFVSFTRQNYQEAVEIYKRLALENREGTAALHVYLALCYFHLDYYDVSLELLAVYLEAHADSFVASNLKASNQFRLYSGVEAAQELETFRKRNPSHPCNLEVDTRHDPTATRAVLQHNHAIFRDSAVAPPSSSAAKAALAPLLDRLDEARMNLVLAHLHRREYREAFELVEDREEPATPVEHIVKAILHAMIGEQTDSKDHIFLAEKYFYAIGTSPSECDTIPGRQSKASYHLLRKEFQEANVYLSSIATYLISSDAFNWNYGLSLAAAGQFEEAEEALLRVQSPALRGELVFCSWLARAYIQNGRHVALAWELYLGMENTADAFKLLKLIANDFYKAQHFYFAVKAFDVLERLDPDPEYWEAKRGASLGFFQQAARGLEPLPSARSDDVLKLLAASKNVGEANRLATMLRKWFKRPWGEDMGDNAELKPWGRFRLVSKDPAAESDHIYFHRTETRIGRNPQRAHVVLNLLFVSGVHCIVKLDGEDESGEPIVRIQDLSRNGIYVNEVRVDQTTGAEISANATIHFTKPGLAVKNIAPTIYRFEILRDGLTPENARLRVERDSSTARLLPAAGTPTQAKGTTAPVVTTQLLTGKKKRRSEGHGEDVSMLEEMEIEVTRTVSSTGAEASPSAKRRRTGDRSSGDEDHDNLLMTSSHLQQTNQGLRAKLSEAAERESKLKHEKGQLERERDNLKDQLQVSEEGRMLAQNEATLKGDLLDDREREIERLKELVDALANQLDESKAEVASLRKNEEAREKLLSEVKAEREKQEMEMITMTNQLDVAQTKVRKSEEQLKSVYEEKKKLELAIDSVQTRTQLVEEDKRGSMEEQMLLKAKIKEMQKFFKDGEALMARGRRMAEDDKSIISAELEALQRSDQSTLYSSEQSQPAPTQENYIGDTQPDDGEDIEQTLDQDAAAARAGLLTMDGAVGPFAADQSKISLHQSISLDLDDQQPPISSFSTEISVDDTPAEQTEGKSSNSESTLSSNSSSSKTPTAPPQPRSKLTAPPLALLEEVEESKGSKSDDEGENADVEDDADDDAEDTALPDEEEAEDDKENTPVAPKGDAVGEAAPKTPQKPGQQGWLQMIVSNEEEKNEQASHSEGIFDDETQLSGGE